MSGLTAAQQTAAFSLYLLMNNRETIFLVSLLRRALILSRGLHPPDLLTT